MKIYKCELYLDGEHNDDEFIAGMEIDASSREEAWEKIMEAIKIEEVEENESEQQDRGYSQGYRETTR